MTLLDGKKLSEQIQEELRLKVLERKNAGKKIPHLAAVLVGTNGASETYVASKVKHCEKIGFKSTLIRFEEKVSEIDLLTEVNRLNHDTDVDGILVQLPLPKQIDVEKVTEAISPVKDVDGFSPVNIGKMVKGLPAHIAATPYGIMLMLERYKIETSGKHCVVIGRSDIVGKPISILMAQNSIPGNCTVTLCHSRTKNLEEISRSADILIAALGKPEFVKADMVKEGAVVIDVGITRVPDETKKSGFRIAGDVAFDKVAPKSSYITPVPGGVGLMTIAALMLNTMNACEIREK
ncbi:MAG TPA: bifunctional 5,10-methylene-tetrahydrofolate dehydrogenase/5,10-methylene-tetrahydrofolate cyclohydrolase [Bacteroidetes bacterium]|nr:bifunctional 5,10-methylene-tetrahydrofolate dehydrogenase/5,10-methylene-tetrahydrofolate cyclohydrolase [Bacteroidota bacterium]